MSMKDWSTTAASNATIASNSGINWQEGQAPSTVNDSARAMMADVRSWYEAAEWIDLGHAPTYASGTSFTVPGDKTAIYTVGRRVKVYNGTSTFYATISAVSFSTNTTVTVVNDGSALSGSLSTVAVGIQNPTNDSEPRTHNGVHTFNSNPILSGGIANGIPYLDGSKNLVSGSALTFNGTYLGVGTGTTGLGKIEIQTGTTTAAVWAQTGGTTNSYTIADFRTGTNASALALKGDASAVFGGKVGINKTPLVWLDIGLTGTANINTTTISKVTDFAANASFGFNGLANNNDGVFFGMGAGGGNGIPAGIGFLREGAGWNTALAFYTNNITSGPNSTDAMQEKARFDSSGAFLVGTTSQSGVGTSILSNNGQCLIVQNTSTTSANTMTQFRNPNGIAGQIITSGSSTAYNTSSDYRLKKNIAPMTGALAKVAALKPVTYIWKVDGSAGEGFIAHELAEVCPHAVAGKKDGTRIEEYQVGTRTVTKQRQVMDLRIEQREEIVVIDGKRVLRMVEHEVEAPLFEDVLVYNEDGSVATVIVPAVLDKDGNVITPEKTVPRTTQVPVMQDYKEEEPVMAEREVPDYQGIDTSFLAGLYAAAIQEQQAIIEQIKIKVGL